MLNSLLFNLVMIKRHLLLAFLSAVLPLAPAISHPITSQEYKYELNLAESKTAISTICMHQQLGFYDAERSQEFTTPYLTNRVKFGDLKPGDPRRVYEWLKADTYRFRSCPGVIDVQILED